MSESLNAKLWWKCNSIQYWIIYRPKWADRPYWLWRMIMIATSKLMERLDK